MKGTKKKMSAKVVAAILESIATFLETTKDIQKTIDMILKMQKKLSA